MSVVGHRGAAVRRPADQARSPVSLWWRGAWGRQLLVEVAVVVGGYLAYKQVRYLVRDHQVEAFANAARIIRWERAAGMFRSEEHTSELQSLMRISYAVFCLKKKKTHKRQYS